MSEQGHGSLAIKPVDLAWSSRFGDGGQAG